MAAKKPSRKPKVLTRGDIDVPKVTYHQPGGIPLANAIDRFALFDWESIHKTIVDGQVAAVTCGADEVDTVLRHLFEWYCNEGENGAPMESRYDPSTRRLFVYSLLRDWSKVQKAG